MEITKIRLRKPTRVFSFVCSDIPLRRDDTCIVKSDRGMEFGICVVPPETCSDDMAERVKMQVIRKATLNDESTFHQLVYEERRAFETCAQMIRDHNLPMKLVDAEYTFDRHKVTFAFTAAERVDFRQLVRDLAQAIKARIELRHIQVRDEAKIVGGIGVCGRELCCATWLTDFKPISMKMAKRQNLSLNPTKISGQCGRLLCCLSYENEMYPGRRSRVAAEAEAERRMTEPLDEDEAVSVTDEQEPLDEMEDEWDDQSVSEASEESESAPQEQQGESAKSSSRSRRRRRKSRGKGGKRSGSGSTKTQGSGQ